MHLREHPGEVCFPGGGWQPGDNDFWQTALRELREELEIAPDRVHLIKQLQSEQTLAGQIIHPWLASIAHLHPYLANEHEVLSVLTIPMKDVRQIDHYKDVTIEWYGRTIKSCQFVASSFLIWGATARIMKQLCEDETSSK